MEKTNNNQITNEKIMDEKMIIDLPPHHHQNLHHQIIMAKFSTKNFKKPFKMSYRRLFSLIFLLLTIINIVSMVITTTIYMKKMDQKEQQEKLSHLISERTNPTNRDAYSIVRFISFISLIASISIRIFGLIAIGICGREFASTEFESSKRHESFTGCLTYTCAMIILLAAYYVNIVRMVQYDLIIHCILTIFGGIFLAFSLQPTDTYSKELNELSI